MRRASGGTPPAGEKHSRTPQEKQKTSNNSSQRGSDASSRPPEDDEQGKAAAMGQAVASVMGAYFMIPCTIFAIIVGIGMIVLGALLLNEVPMEWSARIVGSVSVWTGAALFCFALAFCLFATHIGYKKYKKESDEENRHKQAEYEEMMAKERALDAEWAATSSSSSDKGNTSQQKDNPKILRPKAGSYDSRLPQVVTV